MCQAPPRLTLCRLCGANAQILTAPSDVSKQNGLCSGDMATHQASPVAMASARFTVIAATSFAPVRRLEMASADQCFQVNKHTLSSVYIIAISAQAVLRCGKQHSQSFLRNSSSQEATESCETTKRL